MKTLSKTLLLSTLPPLFSSILPNASPVVVAVNVGWTTPSIGAVADDGGFVPQHTIYCVRRSPNEGPTKTRAMKGRHNYGLMSRWGHIGYLVEASHFPMVSLKIDEDEDEWRIG